jgi:hypothetical protein
MYRPWLKLGVTTDIRGHGRPLGIVAGNATAFTGAYGHAARPLACRSCILPPRARFAAPVHSVDSPPVTMQPIRASRVEANVSSSSRRPLKRAPPPRRSDASSPQVNSIPPSDPIRPKSPSLIASSTAR